MGDDSQESRDLSAARRALLAGVYPRFEALNASLKQSISEWQLRKLAAATSSPGSTGPRPAADEERFLARLGRLVVQARLWLSDAATIDESLAEFRERLDRAMHRVDLGEPEFIASPRVASIHTIWWQLHAQLLRCLGRERTPADT